MPSASPLAERHHRAERQLGRAFGDAPHGGVDRGDQGGGVGEGGDIGGGKDAHQNAAGPAAFGMQAARARLGRIRAVPCLCGPAGIGQGIRVSVGLPAGARKGSR